LNLKKEPSGQKRYGISKLFVIWNSQHLAAELQKQGVKNVTINCSHPGAVATNFGQDSDNGFFNNLVYKVALHLMPAPEKGAVTNNYLSSADEEKGLTGKFFNNKKKFKKPVPKQYTPEKEQQLWDHCMEICAPFLT